MSPRAVLVLLALLIAATPAMTGGPPLVRAAAEQPGIQLDIGVEVGTGAGITAEVTLTAAEPVNVLQGLLDGLLNPGPPAPTPPSPTPPPPQPQPQPQPAPRFPASDSTVKISGVACSELLSGSGFTVDADIVVTNAHVVAGVKDPVVLRPDGTSLAAQVVVFEPRRDVAVLRVPGLKQTPLALGPAVAGTDGLVYGHPGGQDALAVAAVRITSREQIAVPDIYNRPVGPQQVVVLSGDVQRGDSGAAVTGPDGRAVAMVFALNTLSPTLGYAIPSEDLRPSLAMDRSRTADTGPCLS